MSCNQPEPSTESGDIPQPAQSTSESAPSEPQNQKTTKLTNETTVGFLQEYAQDHREDEVLVKTSFGNIRIRLYKNTPLHRASFIYLTKNGYFTDTWFYRVSEGHVIQAGNTDERRTVEKRQKFGDFTIPAEIKEENPHKKGAVAAARSYSNNPEKRSDPYEFYIVLGDTYSASQLQAMKLDVPPALVQLYDSIGGAPHLDGEHTVFGEVVEGMDVVEAINKAEVDEGEWPLMNIPIEVEVVK